MMITLTDQAISKVKDFLEAQERTDLALRVYVKPSGCSGFSYGMGLDEPRESDHSTEVAGIKIVVDPQSLRFVEGAIVDYKEGLMGGGFAIRNPQSEAAGSCGSESGGCGCGSGGCCDQAESEDAPAADQGEGCCGSCGCH